MHTRTFVIVPVSVAPAGIWSRTVAMLESHLQEGADLTLEARFDRVSGLPGRLSDPEAEGLLPAREKRILRHRISFVRNLPPQELPAALVLPSCAWHGVEDFGWRMTGDPVTNARADRSWRDYYGQAITLYPQDYVVEVWVHS